MAFFGYDMLVFFVGFWHVFQQWKTLQIGKKQQVDCPIFCMGLNLIDNQTDISERQWKRCCEYLGGAFKGNFGSFSFYPPTSYYFHALVLSPNPLARWFGTSFGTHPPDMRYWSNMIYTPRKFKQWKPLKNDAWKMILSFWHGLISFLRGRTE